MTKEILINEFNRIWDELREGIKNDPNFFKTKRCKDLRKQELSLKYDMEKLCNNVYDNDTWISKLEMPFTNSQEEARKQAVDMLSKMNGVKVIFDNKNRVKLIEVKSLTKIYQYTINAVACSDIIGYEKEQSAFGEYDRAIFKSGWQAELNQVFNAYRPDEDYILWQLSQD